MRGAIHPLPQYAFMAWCSVKKKRILYLTALNCTWFSKYSDPSAVTTKLKGKQGCRYISTLLFHIPGQKIRTAKNLHIFSKVYDYKTVQDIVPSRSIVDTLHTLGNSGVTIIPSFMNIRQSIQELLK
jgi:hypothetical protein